MDGCERVGEGKLNLDEVLYSRDDLEAFLEVPFGDLEALLKSLAARPNAHEIQGCDLSGQHNGKAIYVWTVYRLRSGREAWKRLYFDSKLGVVHPAA